MTRRTATRSSFRRLLAPLAGVYGLGIRFRNARYDRRPDASDGAALPVISIGNITVGGTGKTPLVIETVRRLRTLGRRPAVLTRGYGAVDRETPDEVLEFLREIPDAPVVVNPDRLAGAHTAQRDHGADCVVLDDGFQHRRLRRDLDVVVIDALDPWGGGRVLPAGDLREPLSSLARADLLVISRSNQVEPEELEQIEVALRGRAPNIEIIRAAVELESITFADERIEDLETLEVRCVLPVCGIGNPTTFLRSVGPLAGRVCRPLVFADHQRYQRIHVHRIVESAERSGADLVVTTRKDWVKLAPLWTAHAAATTELARLDVRLEIHDDDGVFDEHLRHALEKRE